MRYRSVRPRQEALRARLRELAAVRVRSGYRQLHTFLRREGWVVNHKRVACERHSKPILPRRARNAYSVLHVH